MSNYLTLDFSEVRLTDVARVGGKNASLGELYNVLRPLGVSALDGFCTTDDAYWLFIQENNLEEPLEKLFARLDGDVDTLSQVGEEARRLMLGATIPKELEDRIIHSYRQLCDRLQRTPNLAVRSSATAEDLPTASFAGQHDSFLNVEGEPALLLAVRRCFASAFNNRAIDYRARNGFGQLQVALSVGIMPMVASGIGSSGVVFTLDTESGFRDVVMVTGSYGLGETIVQGEVEPDEWCVFKPTLEKAKQPIVSRRLGTKETKTVDHAGGATERVEVPEKDRDRFSLTDPEVVKLAKWAVAIERAYSSPERVQPMDIEWAKDGLTGEMFIIQARPETVHSAKREPTYDVYELQGSPGSPVLTGTAVGTKIATGKVRVIADASQLGTFKDGEVLVSRSTDPDWEPVMKRAAALITDEGGRTAHAAIVSRELGLACIVGTEKATSLLKDGQSVTVCCAEGEVGHVYDGAWTFRVNHLDASSWPHTKTKLMLNVGDPDRAFDFARIPNDGVGLARIEFIVTNAIGIHPMALCRYPGLADAEAISKIEDKLKGEDPKAYFIRRLSEGVGKIAAAFHPRPVIVRLSDFKTNEYAKLLGGGEFEPQEENPMLGFRGASRYYDARYEEGFALECAALKAVREDMGLDNVRVMIPFCRTVAEANAVLKTMAQRGLKQGENNLEVYGMCEVPSNVVMAEEFLEVLDGYSIGSNDLTQLILGVDRDSGTISRLFDEQDAAVKRMVSQVIKVARDARKPIGICGQAPSDYPEFAAWLIEQGITSISVNPDSAFQTAVAMQKAEHALEGSALINVNLR